MNSQTETRPLNPRQSAFLQAYSDPNTSTFGNAYRSALSAGYSEQTARNITHMQPEWLSENLGQMGNIIQPEEIMQELTRVIHDPTEPTIIRLKATELAMKAYSMTAQKRDPTQATVSINVDLSAS